MKDTCRKCNTATASNNVQQPHTSRPQQYGCNNGNNKLPRAEHSCVNCMFHLAALFVIACRQRQTNIGGGGEAVDVYRGRGSQPANEISCKTNSTLNLIFTLLIRRVIQFRVFVQRSWSREPLHQRSLYGRNLLDLRHQQDRVRLRLLQCDETKMLLNRLLIANFCLFFNYEAQEFQLYSRDLSVQEVSFSHYLS